MQRTQSTIDDLLFVGFHGKVLAVHRASGERVWRWVAPKSWGGTVMILPDRDRLFVCCMGYTWALDPATGRELWYQPFQGEGTGIPMLATMRGAADGQSTNAAAAAAEAAQQAATANAAMIAAASTAAAAASSAS